MLVDAWLKVQRSPKNAAKVCNYALQGGMSRARCVTQQNLQSQNFATSLHSIAHRVVLDCGSHEGIEQALAAIEGGFGWPAARASSHSFTCFQKHSRLCRALSEACSSLSSTIRRPAVADQGCAALNLQVEYGRSQLMQGLLLAAEGQQRRSLVLEVVAGTLCSCIESSSAKQQSCWLSQDAGRSYLMH